MIDYLNLEISTPTSKFLIKLKEFIDEDVNFWENFPLIIPFSYNSKKKYYGSISSNKFFLRQRVKFMDFNYKSSGAKGKITSIDNKTKLEIEINGYYYWVILLFFIGVILFMYIIISNEAYPALILFVPLFILIFLSITSSIKKDVKNFKKELEYNLKSISN